MKDYEIDSTEMDTEYDIIDEMKDTIEEIEETYKNSDMKTVTDQISYMKFLIKELDDSLSGQYAELRRRRFIVKKTP